jgi:uncharacterized cupin superfamily protein
LINRGNRDAIVLEIGSRAATERAHHWEIDMLAVRRTPDMGRQGPLERA